MRRTNTNKKNHSIFGAFMVYIGATTILLFALLPYVIPRYFVPLPTIASFVFVIVAFALFCYVYVTMCISLRKTHKKTQEVLSYEY